MEDGGIEMEMRTIKGISYSIRAWDDHAQTRKLHVRNNGIESEHEVSELVGAFEGYVFAVPDREELRKFLAQRRHGATKDGKL